MSVVIVKCMCGTRLAMNASVTTHKRWCIFSVIFFLLLWEILAQFIRQEIIVPTIGQTLHQLWTIVTADYFFQAVGATIARVGMTFFIDLGAALVLGCLAGLSLKVEQTIKPLEIAMRAVPLESETAPVFVCSLIIFPILYRSVVEGIRNIDPQLREMHDIYEIPLRKRIRGFYFPSVKPFLSNGIKAAMGLNVKVMIAAEVLSQPNVAIGTYFQIERARLNTAGVLAWSLIVIALAAVFEHAMNLLLASPRRSVSLPETRRL
ncbi:ABC transporter permease [candidate division KSB3 bacterium]|nr:MAG: ABC transporter permease [candidate division KSB3 bacterium]